MKRLSALLALGLTASFAFAASKHEMAITVDGLPVAQSGHGACGAGGMQVQTLRLLEQFLRQKAPLTAFVVAGACPDLADVDRQTVLKLWQDAGAELGSQTYSEPDLNTVDPAAFEADVMKADQALRPLLGGQRLRYFRFPMLRTGPTPEVTARIAKFLLSHGYTNAPVTIDNSDWMFSAVYSEALAKGEMETVLHVKDDYVHYLETVVDFYEQRTQEVVGREIPQILRLNANRLNADLGADLLTMLKRRGYKFITLTQALKDPAYQLPDSYAGAKGISWINHWSISKGVPDRAEPPAPRWLEVEYSRLPKMNDR
jgi:peptidoglycan/xylan/chitin deacetylase (PgdA/CDA1 family)